MSIPDTVPVGMALFYATIDDRVEAARRARKLHIRGPLRGALWLCYRPNDVSTLTASGMSPEQAWNNWQSYWGEV